jgi:hypothetical protein
MFPLFDVAALFGLNHFFVIEVMLSFVIFMLVTSER